MANELLWQQSRYHSQPLTPHPVCFVIWGFNIVIIIGLLDRLTGAFLPRRPATLVIKLLLALYAVLAGGAPSVVRAMAMAMGRLSLMSYRQDIYR